MGFTLRIQSPSGLKRIELASVCSTWAELQTKIASKFGIPPSEQRISRTRLHQPDFILCSPSTPVGGLGLEHGSMLFLADIERPDAEKLPSFRLTDKCEHGPRGRCMHCLSRVEDGAPVAEWLCTHPASAFCPKCLPPPDPEEQTATEVIKAADGSQEYKVDVIPYAHMMKEKQAMCRFKHSDMTVCHRCAPPAKIEFRGKPNCDSGHRPWPQGICGRCAPPNAVLALQKFRHCDGISFKDVSAGERFIGEWSTNPARQRAALLFGRYISEPTKSKFFGAIRAEVEGLYVPPQEGHSEGVTLLRDPNEKNLLAIAKALGLECVGWAVTTLPRGGDEFGGDIFMSGKEVLQAAAFQEKFSDELGHSRFVTMVIQYNKQGNIEPRAYQISDQGVAMARDGLITAGSKAGYIQPRTEKKGEFVPSIVYKSRSLEAGKDFLPDELLVKVVAMKPYKPKPMFKYVHFPSVGSEQAFRVHLSRHADEPYHLKFSDFALLTYLPNIIGLDMAVEVAKSVKEKKEPVVLEKLDRSLLKYYA